MNDDLDPNCCRVCRDRWAVGRPFRERMLSRMIACPNCGNKRCPKASDHALACTQSNDLGQPGSAYA